MSQDKVEIIYSKECTYLQNTSSLTLFVAIQATSTFFFVRFPLKYGIEHILAIELSKHSKRTRKVLFRSYTSYLSWMLTFWENYCYMLFAVLLTRYKKKLKIKIFQNIRWCVCFEKKTYYSTTCFFLYITLKIYFFSPLPELWTKENRSLCISLCFNKTVWLFLFGPWTYI